MVANIIHLECNSMSSGIGTYINLFSTVWTDRWLFPQVVVAVGLSSENAEHLTIRPIV